MALPASDGNLHLPLTNPVPSGPSATTTIPQGPSSTRTADSCVRRSHKASFPCSTLERCLPCLPSRLTKIQDWLHLVLVIGVFGCLVCLGAILIDLASNGCHEATCLQRLIAVVVLPTLLYFMELIRHYDQDLRAKKATKDEEADDLVREVNHQVDEISKQRDEIMDHCNKHADRQFRDRRVDFERFLKDRARNYVENAALDELKLFVQQWLENFSTKLLNAPKENPIVKGLQKDLQRCSTPGDVCSIVKKRLSENIVHTQIAMPPPRAARSRPKAMEKDEESGSDAQIATCRVSWIRCRSFPCCVRILSKLHAYLLVAFFSNILLLVLEGTWHRWFTLTLVALNEVCITSTLACIEDIEEIARLEMDIQRLKGRKKDVVRQREETNAQWAQVQELQNIWQYRTLPTFSIMKTIHMHLTDIDDQAQMVSFLQEANASLKTLRLKLDDVWASGERTTEWGVRLGILMSQVETQEDAEELLRQLPDVEKQLNLLGMCSEASRALADRAGGE